MNTMSAAIGFEWLKLRRARLTWVATVVLGLAVPLLSTGLLAAARSDSTSQLAVKARTMATETGWSGQFTVAGQFLSVAVLVVVGVVACWIFGREFTDRTVAGLLSLPTTRIQFAVAKFTVLSAWATVTCALAAVTIVVAGLVTETGALRAHDWAVLGKLFLAALLTIILTAPLALASSLWRGYLAGIGILFGLLVVTQLATAAGLGGWFPYAAPGLWLGLGGTDAAAAITLPQLLLPLPIGLGAAVATLLWWNGNGPTENR
ncbi:hypothetical protein Snas_3665 [Stackebrandtia nassauensis DSM 44728]|uniref:Uncharacterized protein n=2 Tax=Stackebrandtia TaxID=283810 RepID=D3PXJ3_STANL|nr:hypothetical protein Snas_3665 [Stackebrandtia nassauensis DSM 44728]